jgi:hypothetical protein
LLFSSENKIIAQRKKVVPPYILPLSLFPHLQESDTQAGPLTQGSRIMQGKRQGPMSVFLASPSKPVNVPEEVPEDFKVVVEKILNAPSIKK